MPDLITNPITPEHLRRMDDSLRQIADAVTLCDKAEQIGIDCEEYRKAFAMYEEWFRTAKGVFFPDTVPGPAAQTRKRSKVH